MLPPVPCTIAHPGGSLLTMEEPNGSAPLIILPATGNPGEQEVSATKFANILSNLAHELIVEN